MLTMPRFLAALALALAVASQAFAQSMPAADLDREVQAALARPVSPGSVALLLPYTSRPAVVERLSRALRDPNPDVRAVAARIAFTTRHQGLVTPLAAALDAESVASPAAEMVRALALIAGPAGDDAALKAIERVPHRAATAWIEVVSRTRPGDIQPRLATTRALEAPYLALIEQLEGDDAPLPWPIVVAGLRASPAMRRSIARLLLHRRDAGTSLPAEAAALDDLRAPAAAAADPFLALTFELVRRREHPGDASMSLAPVIAALDPKAAVFQGWRDRWLHRLSDSEEQALRARTHLSERKEWAAETGPPVKTAKPQRAPRPIEVRMANPLTPGLATELGVLTGCPPAADQIVAVQVEFRPTGQVRQVYEPVGAGVAKCGQAARVLAALDLAPGSSPLEAGRSDLLMIGFRPEDASCPRIVEIRDGDEPPPRPGSKVRAPRKIRNVQPVYPQGMQDDRIQGVVIIEAFIASKGCVTDAKVLKGPHTTLEAAALAAVSLWRYEPTILDGKPVPVVMTVTVNFTLQ